MTGRRVLCHCGKTPTGAICLKHETRGTAPESVWMHDHRYCDLRPGCDQHRTAWRSSG